MSSGCPKCGSERLKSAPLVGVDPLVRLVSMKRRYKCAACGWTGWHRRLRRRNNDVPSLTPRQKPQRRAWAFFVFAALFLVVSGAMLFRECGTRPSAPIDGGTP